MALHPPPHWFGRVRNKPRGVVRGPAGTKSGCLKLEWRQAQPISLMPGLDLGHPIRTSRTRQNAAWIAGSRPADGIGELRAVYSDLLDCPHDQALHGQPAARRGLSGAFQVRPGAALDRRQGRRRLGPDLRRPFAGRRPGAGENRPRHCRRHRPRRQGRGPRLPGLEQDERRDAQGVTAQDRRQDRRPRRRDRLHRMHGYRPGAPLHEQGGAARGR